MYLMYDVLRLQKSSLGYGLLTKRRDWPRVRNKLESLTTDKINEAINAFSNITDSTINSLLWLLRSISTHDPHSFASKMTRRAR